MLRVWPVVLAFIVVIVAVPAAPAALSPTPSLAAPLEPALADPWITIAGNNGSDPLAGRRTIADSADVALVWAELPDTNASDTFSPALNQKLLTVEPNPTTPPLYRLNSGPTLGEPTNGPAGGAQVAAAAGDFNGDGFSDLVAAWEGPGKSVQIVVPQRVGGALNWSSAVRLTAGATIRSSGNAQSLPADGRIRLATGDFDGDGQAEFALAFQQEDGFIRVEIYDTDDTLTPVRRAVISNERVSTAASELARFDLAAGDINGNGKDELVLAGLNTTNNGDPLFVRIYEVGANSATLTARGRQTISSTPTESEPYTDIAVTLGDFDRANDNLRQEIAVGVFHRLNANAHNQSNPNTFLYLLRSDANLGNPTTDPTKRLAVNRGNVGEAVAIDLAAGDMTGDGKDEIAFAQGRSVYIYETSAALDLIERGTVGYDTGPISSEDGYFQQQFIAIADIDSDLKAELVVAGASFRVGTGSGDPARQNFTVRGYTAALNPGGQITGLNTVFDYTGDERTGGNFDNPPRRRFALALGDFNGTGFRIGTPRYYNATEVVQPLVVLNAPPNHFDIFAADGSSFAGPPYPDNARRDINNCYLASCEFFASYARTQTDVSGFSARITRDWSVSAGVSVNIKGIFDAGLKATYGEKFERFSDTSTSFTITQRVTAFAEDQVYATVVDYDVWEYDIFANNATTPTGTLLVVSPRRVKNEWFSTKSYSAINLETQHEVGNILSYPEDVPSNGELDADFVIKSDVFNLSDANGEFSIRRTDFTSSGASTTRSFGLEANASVGFKGLGLSLSGTYNTSDLSTHTASVQETIQIDTKFVGLNQSIGTVNYRVEPYAYWAKSGPLVVDYAVRPVTAPIGQPQTWWDVHYKQRPDPAFKLLWRYDPEKGRTLTDPRQRLLNWEIGINPRRADVGDTVKLSVPVYNYSLVPVTSVKVAFYRGNPAAGGTLIGETVIASIEARGRRVAEVDWTIPANTGRVTPIYAVIDPDNTLTEIHKNNNVSFNALILECTTCVPADLSVTSDAITFSNAGPRVGDQVTISARISATQSAANVLVSFFRGDPSQGNRIGDATLVEIPAGGSATASVVWNTSGLTAGAYPIFVVIQEQEGEPNSANNRASRTITLTGGGSTGGGTTIFLPLVRR
jgi:hypothetical protein